MQDRQANTRRHVWVAEGNQLHAVEVVSGINDNDYTEMVSGKLSEGQLLVTGIR